jgi:16S rRNA C967 or C1407 C5-methylase (RsmB/RsmF family)
MASEQEKPAAAPAGDDAWRYRCHPDSMRKTTNPHFERFYKEHNPLVPAAAFDDFMETLRTPLPTTLWINDTDPLAPEISRYFTSLGDTVMSPIPWYPIAGMGWRINADKKTFRKAPELQPLRQYLIRQTAMGTTSRQEEVSMIPTFLLDIQAEDRCFDTCASPGSKTAQMLATLGRAKKVTEHSTNPFPFDYLSGGYVVANEIDEKRANMLVHQCKRLRLLFPFAVFTNHDSVYYPDIYDEHGVERKFDKILCDVVCTGDGTLRKAPQLMARWRPFEANNLQKLQVRIALRSAHLLRVGGRMVYSTCSFNPIENEAVVTQIIKATGYAMKLVDASALLPKLKFAPGWKTWAVVSNKGDVVTTPGEASMHEACFPVDEDLGLEKCMRLLPEHCGGGGFFVAVLEKVKEYTITLPPPKAPEVLAAAKAARDAERAAKDAARAKAQDEADAKAVAAGETPKTRKPAKIGTGGGRGGPKTPKGEDRLMPQYLPARALVAAELAAGKFQVPGFPLDNLFARTPTGEEALRATRGSTTSFVSSAVRSLLMHKERKLLVVSVGLRVFVAENLTKGWRIAQEATPLFMNGLMAGSPRIVPVATEDFIPFIGNGSLNDVKFDDIANAALRATVMALEICAFVFRVECAAAPGGYVPCSALRARNRVQLLVDKEDLADLCCRMALDEAIIAKALLNENEGAAILAKNTVAAPAAAAAEE